MTRSQLSLLTIALQAAMSTAVPGADDPPTRPPALLDRQLDVSLEARDIERVLGKVKQASDLAKQRIGEAATSAEATVKSLEGRDKLAARERAAVTSQMLHEVTVQLEILLKEDLPDQVAATQRLVEELAELERELAMMLGQGDQKPESPMPPGKGGKNKEKEPKSEKSKTGKGQSEDERKKDLEKRADQLAAKARTIEDVLKALSASTNPADREALENIEQILAATKLKEALETVKRGASGLQAGSAEEARTAGLDAADRLEIAAQRLGETYRRMIAPRAEELRQLEERLARLQAQAEDLKTPASLSAWKESASDLLDKLKEMNVGEDNLAEFSKLLAAGESNSNSMKDAWQAADGRSVPPATLKRTLARLQSDVQARLQALLIGDLHSDDNGATPARYVELVDRYYDVLSREPVASGRKAQP